MKAFIFESLMFCDMVFQNILVSLRIIEKWFGLSCCCVLLGILLFLSVAEGPLTTSSSRHVTVCLASLQMK